jgi:hypothetical protein
MSVISYLDCGCAILSDGGREWCPTCAAKLEASENPSNKPQPAEGQLRETIAEMMNPLENHPDSWEELLEQADRIILKCHAQIGRELIQEIEENPYQQFDKEGKPTDDNSRAFIKVYFVGSNQLQALKEKWDVK